MKWFAKAADNFQRFYAMKRLPDPATFEGAEIELAVYDVDREPFWRNGQASQLMHFRVGMVRYVRVQDAEGNWVWALPCNPPAQNWQMN